MAKIYWQSKHDMFDSKSEAETKVKLFGDDPKWVRAYVEKEELESVQVDLSKAFEEIFELKMRLKKLGEL